jgi:hypothetical protein
VILEEKVCSNIKRFKKCKDCPEYSKCVMEADLRRKRNRCKYAIKSTEKGGAE